MVRNLVDLGDRRQRRALHLRAAALSSTLLAGAVFRAHFFWPWAFPYYIIAFWSFVDGALRLSGRHVHSLISVVLDAVSTGWSCFHAPLLLIDWYLEENGYSLIAFLLLAASLYYHGKLFFGAAGQCLRGTKEKGKSRRRGAQLPL